MRIVMGIAGMCENVKLYYGLDSDRGCFLDYRNMYHNIIINVWIKYNQLLSVYYICKNVANYVSYMYFTVVYKSDNKILFEKKILFDLIYSTNY